MKIAKYVGDLLYDYECVVIPGLGGFLTNDKPATINTASNLLKPPFKQVFFNAYLKANDGLLVNYVAREEGIEYKAAKEQVDRFVLLCNNALNEGKRINFHRIGYLYLNPDQKISFDQDTEVNYNPEAFGLTSFISPAIYKPSPEERLREKVSIPPSDPESEKRPQKLSENKKENSSSVKKRMAKKPMIASKRRSPYHTQLSILMVMILAMFIGWGFLHKKEIKKYYSNYSSVIPLFYSSPNAYLIDNINHAPLSKISKSKTGLWVVSLFEKMEHTNGKKLISKTNNRVAAEIHRKTKVSTSSQMTPQTRVVKSKTQEKISEPVLNTPNEKVADNSVAAEKKNRVPVSSPKNSEQNGIALDGMHFYIIAGAFKYRDNAENLIHKLRLKGYPAMEAGVTKTGLVRVAFGAFNDVKEAEKQLYAIRKSENPSAWIFEN